MNKQIQEAIEKINQDYLDNLPLTACRRCGKQYWAGAGPEECLTCRMNAILATRYLKTE